MTRKTAPENKTRIRQSPLPVIAVVVGVILLVFYGWSQRVWLSNVTDIESRDVDMQSRQLERGFATELEDLYAAVGDYSISDDTAELARGNRPDYFAETLNAGALVRLDVDTFLVLDKNLETRASLAIDATVGQEYEIPPDPDLLAAIKQGVTSGQLNSVSDSERGIVRARAGAVRRASDLRFQWVRPTAGMDRLRARLHAVGGRAYGSLLAVARHRLRGRESRSRRLAR